MVSVMFKSTVQPTPLKGHLTMPKLCPYYRGSFVQHLADHLVINLRNLTHTHTAVVTFHWNATEDQMGVHFICFTAKDHTSLLSAPLCLTVVIGSNFEVRLIGWFVLVWKYEVHKRKD